MSNFLQGGALPNVTETTTTTTAPTTSEYSTLLSDISKAGSTAIGRTPSQSVAALDPLQTQGYGMVPGAATSYQPGLSAAQGTAGRAAQGITSGRIQNLMNPYTTNVVNELARLSQQNVERSLMPTMNAAFVGTGGLGSQRYANAMGQSLADVQANLTGQQYGALSKGYSEALKGALDEAQLLNQTAKTQGELSKLEQELGLTGAGALTKAGAERQAYAQSLLDAPMKNARAAADLLRGYTMPGTETRTFVGPRPNTHYQSSDAQRLGTLSTFLGSANTARTRDLLRDAGQGLLQFLRGENPSISLGGGLSLGFDPRTNAPFISGGTPPSAGGDDTINQIYRDAGFVQDETGVWYDPTLDYSVDYGD